MHVHSAFLTVAGLVEALKLLPYNSHTTSRVGGMLLVQKDALRLCPKKLPLARLMSQIVFVPQPNVPQIG